MILNCHGTSGTLSVGGSSGGTRRNNPIQLVDVPVLSALKTYSLGTLWCVACYPALGATGQTFCSALAKACNCRVVASEDVQRIDSSDRAAINLAQLRNTVLANGSYAGIIDEYEGTVWQFDSSGNMAPCVPHVLFDAVY